MVFASDALSSTAYATQEILVILAAAGVGAFIYAFPIALGIVILLSIVAISYEQTIHAYPDGGGAYIVSRDNLGDLPAQMAGAALLTDYILTVAVAVSSGVSQITSAFPALFTWRVELAIVFIFLVMFGESTWRERVWGGLCYSYLLFCCNDVFDGCLRFLALCNRDVGHGCRSAASGSKRSAGTDQRLFALTRFFERYGSAHRG